MGMEEQYNGQLNLFIRSIRSGNGAMSRIATTISVVSTLFLTSCTLAPKETSEEKKRVDLAGKPYESPAEARKLPELSDTPTWQEVLHRAFLANGDLEATYFEWRAAMARID